LKEGLESAKNLGAVIISGGRLDAKLNYIEPTVITNFAATNPLMTDEIFGPILPIVYMGNKFLLSILAMTFGVG
ncbi:aldehyde dehydrogenase family protein, partial [Sphingobacterium daejeonense]|uniref:aldehyde dehydrogenase family protein n=1 Tax=Sphingobacterium daejeonense TaxID=371142 RepID=UPI003D30F503